MIRLAATALLVAGLLFLIILNPLLVYANKTIHNGYTGFQNIRLEPDFLSRLDQAAGIWKTSEFYNPDLRLDICLNDGSKYPKLIRALRGQAFAWGFYDKVVLQGTANSKENYLQLNGYRWNLAQLLAHEMTHCLQFDKLGFWKSKPMANIPDWKWEGYAEYVSRQDTDQQDLSKNIERFIATDEKNWDIPFADGTLAPRGYYDSWILVQYCIDIKKMTYRQILTDTTGEKRMRQEMMNWYGRQ